MGNAVDDARRLDGVWYRRDIITKKFVVIMLQRRVVPLFKNPRPISVGSDRSTSAKGKSVVPTADPLLVRRAARIGQSGDPYDLALELSNRR
jgi:hypothetical protein